MWLARLDDALERLLEAEREQLPLWIPIGLGFGITAWFLLAGEAAWIAFLLGTSGIGLGFAAIGGGKRWGRSFATFAILAAIGCGLVWLRSDLVAAPKLSRPTVAEVVGTVSLVEPLPARDTVRVLLRPDNASLPPTMRVNIPAKAVPGSLTHGAVIKLKARLMPPAPMAVPGAYDFARVAWFKRIGATGNALGPVLMIKAGETSGLAAKVAQWRQRLSAHIQSQAGTGGGIAAALATGDQGAIGEEDAEAMRRSGLAHLLSISGLHVTAVVGAAMFLTLRILALSPRLALRWPLVLIAAGVGAGAGIAYTLLTGSEVPTIRSCVAALIVLGGVAMGREAITLRLVAAGALVVLIFWPESLAGPSFQLSFAAVTAIIVLHEHPKVKALFARRDETMGARLGRNILSLLLTGIGVELALAPIALFHFHRSGVYGAFANIVAIPLTTFVIMPAEALALTADIVGWGAPFWWVVERALALLLGLAHKTANAPGSVAMLPGMPAAAFAVMVVGGLWLALWRRSWRRWGFVPFAFGAFWALATRPPDIIVTGDGRHLALRTPGGGMALLRGRAGDYVRDMVAENAGLEGEIPAMEDVPGMACSADMCVADISKGGRRWRLLATRSAYHVDFGPLKRACADADIVVSDRRLPRTCVPRWLKIDRAFLERSGGLAITLGRQPEMRSVADSSRGHPWSDY